MRGEWIDKAIGDIADVVGGSTPSTKDPANFDGDVPWLTPKDLAGPHPRYVSRGERNLSRKGLQSCSAQLLPANSVLLSSRAPIGYLAIAANPIATNQGFRSLIVKPGYDHEYVYYWLSANVDELERHATGSTFKELSGSALRHIRIRLPKDYREQRAIAHILGTLDDKIELNRRMSETLKQMATALFKSWFVDFDPVRAKMEGRWRRGQSLPGLPAHLHDLFPDRLVPSELGEIPEGWKVESIAKAFTIEDGRTLPPDVRRKDGPYVAYGANGPIGGTTEAWVDSPCIVLGKIGTCGALHRSPLPCWVTNNAFAVRAGTCGSIEFVWHTLKDIDFSNYVGGSANPYMPLKNFGHHQIVVPPPAALQCFQTFAGGLRALSEKADSESRTLAALRDALLPKLISGQIRVKDAEKFLKERGL